MPDAFSDSRHIVKSHIPAISAPTRVEIPIHKSVSKELTSNSKLRQKRGRPVGAKDVVPRKRKIIGHAYEVASVPDNTPEVVSPPEEVKTPEVVVTKPPEVVLPLEEDIAPEVAHVFIKAKGPESYEISLSYVHNGKLLDRGSIEFDDVYAFFVACDIIMNSDPEPQSVKKCR